MAPAAAQQTRCTRQREQPHRWQQDRRGKRTPQEQALSYPTSPSSYLTSEPLVNDLNRSCYSVLTVIPLLDLRAQYDQIRAEIEPAIARVLKSGRYVLGPEVDAFEQEFAQFCTSRYAVGVNSGTSAIYLALLASGIGTGDEVITVPFTFEATVAAIRATGASVKLVDIDPDSLTMSAAEIERRVTRRTKAIVPVHLFGQPADMDPIAETAGRHGLTVIEDACQAHGARYNGRLTGSLGHAGCFSFYPSKNLGTFGEGGMIVTDDGELAERARQLRSWGPPERSANYRLSALEAAVLRVKLPHLADWTARRQAIAAQYRTLLSDCPLQLPRVMPYSDHVFHIYAVRSSKRHALAEALQRKGIGVAVHYPESVHMQAKYRDLGYPAGEFPVAEQAADEELSLPIYPELSNDSLVQVAEAIRELVGVL